MQELVPYVSAVMTEHEYRLGLGKEYSQRYVHMNDGKILFHCQLAHGCSVKRFVPKVPTAPAATGAGVETPKLEITGAISEEINFLPGGKVPIQLLHHIVLFFRAFMAKHPHLKGLRDSDHGSNLEAMAHILWNSETQQYEIGIPKQTVGAASVHYEFDDVDPAKHTVVVDIHSHNSMGAFFSGTDNGDDRKGIWYSGVVGNLDKDVPTLKWRFNHYDFNKEVQQADIFDYVFEPFEVPAAWLDKVAVSAPVTNYGGRQGYSGYGGAGGFPSTGQRNHNHRGGKHSRGGASDQYDDNYDWRGGGRDLGNSQGGSGAGSRSSNVVSLRNSIVFPYLEMRDFPNLPAGLIEVPENLAKDYGKKIWLCPRFVVKNSTLDIARASNAVGVYDLLASNYQTGGVNTARIYDINEMKAARYSETIELLGLEDKPFTSEDYSNVNPLAQYCYVETDTSSPVMYKLAECDPRHESSVVKVGESDKWAKLRVDLANHLAQFENEAETRVNNLDAYRDGMILSGYHLPSWCYDDEAVKGLNSDPTSDSSLRLLNNLSTCIYLWTPDVFAKASQSEIKFVEHFMVKLSPQARERFQLLESIRRTRRSH